ncbi:MAG TPA: RNA methyltransferase [Gemmatimonadota bacterium]
MPEGSALPRRKEALLRSLARKSVRDSRARFVAEGPRVVEEALASRWKVTDLVAAPSAAQDVRRWEAEGRLAGVPVHRVDERAFRRVAESVHPQGVLAVVERPDVGLPRTPAAAAVLVLDRVQDPGNAGTLLRTLLATGGRTAVALAGTVDLFNPKVVRSSAGSLFHLDVAVHVAADAALAWLEEHAIPLVALDPSGEPLFAGDWCAPAASALAVGNEGAGLDPRLLGRAARRLAIPMEGGVESLNAAVAGSLALYELRRRRELGGAPADGAPASGAQGGRRDPPGAPRRRPNREGAVG